jgi:hypothetical protein
VLYDHRQLGVDLFNHTWTLLDKAERTADEDDEMLGAAHASRYHWSKASTEAKHQARGEWQLARVYAVLGRGEPAVHHARRCLDWSVSGDVEDWDVAFAHEALSRAYRVAGDDEKADEHKALARDLGDAIADPEDREHFDADFRTL